MLKPIMFNVSMKRVPTTPDGRIRKGMCAIGEFFQSLLPLVGDQVGLLVE